MLQILPLAFENVVLFLPCSSLQGAETESGSRCKRRRTQRVGCWKCECDHSKAPHTRQTFPTLRSVRFKAYERTYEHFFQPTKINTATWRSTTRVQCAENRTQGLVRKKKLKEPEISCWLAAFSCFWGVHDFRGQGTPLAAIVSWLLITSRGIILHHTNPVQGRRRRRGEAGVGESGDPKGAGPDASDGEGAAGRTEETGCRRQSEQSGDKTNQMSRNSSW